MKGTDRPATKTGTGVSCGNGGAVESMESQKRFPLFPRAPWEFRQKQARFPHSHSSGDETVEKWKTKSRFPTFPPPSGGFRTKKKPKAADCVGEEKGHFYRGKEGDISNEA
jgi:hypothetical protein